MESQVDHFSGEFPHPLNIFWDSSWERRIASGRSSNWVLWCQNFSAPVLWSPSDHTQKRHFRQRLKIYDVDSSNEKKSQLLCEWVCLKSIGREIFTLHCLPNPNPPKKYLGHFYFLLLSPGHWRALRLPVGFWYKIPEWSICWSSFLNEWRLHLQLPQCVGFKRVGCCKGKIQHHSSLKNNNKTLFLVHITFLLWAIQLLRKLCLSWSLEIPSSSQIVTPLSSGTVSSAA